MEGSSPYHLAAERRATSVDETAACPPVPSVPRKDAVAEPRGEAALTRRERKVKQILLKELEKLNSWQGFSYAERQNVVKRLNVEYLDREIAQMKKGIRWFRRVAPLAVLYGLFYSIWIMELPWAEQWWEVLLGLTILIGYSAAPLILIRSVRRKLFIYEALRELSDAEEIDVILDRAAREADALIDQIVRRELAADRLLPADPSQLRS
jgi:hypothetical protein